MHILDLELVTRDLGELLAAAPKPSPPLALNNGQATVGASVAGSLATPRITAHLAAERLSVAGRQFEVLGAATGDASVLRQALNTVEPGVFRLDYGQLMRSIDALLRGAELPVVIDLVTDIQQSGLPTRFGELAPRRAAEVAIHDVSGGKADNWTIESFGGSALTGELEASVRSFAATDARKSVRLTLNGKTVLEYDLDSPATRA